jgi:RHS repeat-associated protein
MSTMDRFVWDGDQLAHELRAKLPYFTHGWGLEVEVTLGDFYGRIRYAHAGDMDRPVLIWKDLNTPFVPHWNFRGMAVAGSDPTSGNPLQNMSWPGRDRGAYFGADTRITPTIPTHWQGSLTDAQGDGTGQLYRRNRYFNPNTAQFTQEDPIGLIGGLNLYGFATGDPVNHSEPFGLCPLPPSNCLDIAVAVTSVGTFIANPSFGAAASALFDVAGALPGVPSVGVIRRSINAIGDVTTLRRPYIRRGVREAVERQAQRGPGGEFLDANTLQPIQGSYDLGHKHGREFRRERARAQSQGLTQKEFNDRMNNPDLYQIENPRSNRSHRYEKKP